jgi:hypothetical protein
VILKRTTSIILPPSFTPSAIIAVAKSLLVELGKHLGLEPLRQDDRYGDTTSPSVGEQREHAALSCAETTFSRWHRHHWFPFANVRW